MKEAGFLERKGCGFVHPPSFAEEQGLKNSAFPGKGRPVGRREIFVDFLDQFLPDGGDQTEDGATYLFILKLHKKGALSDRVIVDFLILAEVGQPRFTKIAEVTGWQNLGRNLDSITDFELQRRGVLGRVKNGYSQVSFRLFFLVEIAYFLDFYEEIGLSYAVGRRFKQPAVEVGIAIEVEPLDGVLLVNFVLPGIKI
jgi:hypothetical protein